MDSGNIEDGECVKYCRSDEHVEWIEEILYSGFTNISTAINNQSNIASRLYRKSNRLWRGFMKTESVNSR